MLWLYGLISHQSTQGGAFQYRRSDGVLRDLDDWLDTLRRGVGSKKAKILNKGTLRQSPYTSEVFQPSGLLPVLQWQKKRFLMTRALSFNICVVE